jgi:NAD(P)-dependent dehydrogenase (short-subunit alcohol dehydrogenase family)
MQVDGKVCLITGASKGIGRAVALALAAKGARLLLVARGEAALEATSQECRDAGSPRVVTLVADVGDLAGLDAIVMTAVREFDGFDVLVNNAGGGAVKPIEEVTDEEFDRAVAVNLRAPFMLTQAAVKTLRRRGGGQVINIGSGLSYFGRAGWSLYAATKFGLRGMTESVRHEVAKQGIKVCLVAPGYTETHFFDDFEEPVSFDGALQPEDIAHAVLAVIEQPPTSDIKEVTVRGPKSP